MALTGQQFIDYMRHRLGKTPASRHRLVDDLNDAGRHLFTAGQAHPYNHRWTWAARHDQLFPIAANDKYVRLPADFGELIDVQQQDRTSGGVTETTLGNILQLESDVSIDPLRIYAAFDVGRDQDNDQVHAGKWAVIFPVQSSARTDIRISYYANWIDYSVKSDGTIEDGGRVPNIPTAWERLLKLYCMAFATAVEDGSQPIESPMIAQELERLVRVDSHKQTNYGQPVTSVRARARGRQGIRYPHRSITR